jgi:hypothetical protein
MALYDPIKKIAKDTDWKFLFFLLIFLNQSNFSFKIIGIIFIYIIRPDFKFGLFKGRIPKFYLLIIILAIVNLVFNIRDFSGSYMAAFGMACMLWLFSFLAYHQLKLSVEKYGEKTDNTIKVFTVLNTIVCIVQLVIIMAKTNTVNPYRGLAFPYGISTGDNIYGLLLQNCYNNVFISSFLTIYFLYKKNIYLSLCSLLCVVLVFANGLTLILLGMLTFIFLVGILANIYTRRGAWPAWASQIKPPGIYRTYIPVYFLFVLIISYIISPENFTYSANTIVLKIHNVFSNTGDAEKARIYKLKESNSSFKDDSNFNKLIGEKSEISRYFVHHFSGKNLSFAETRKYAKSSISAFLFGAGPVRFSSLTAQKMAGYDSSRIFRKFLPEFSSPLYNGNHKLIVQARVESTDEYQSAINFPDSFYNQILGEYGFIGVFLFLIYYVWFFVKRIHYWTYGLWLSILLIPFAYFSYTFEPLAFIIIYEFLMENDTMKYNANKSTNSNRANAGI